VAAAVEAGNEVKNIAESGLIDFQQLQSFWELQVEMELTSDISVPYPTVIICFVPL